MAATIPAMPRKVETHVTREGRRRSDIGWSLGVLLRACHRATTAVIGDLPHGPRGYQVLATVVHEDQPSQLALAERLGIDRTVMTYLIDDLVDAGLVERQPNPRDRRQRRIVATQRGARTLARLERQVHEAENAVMAALDPAERASFRAMLRRVAADVHDIDDAADLCDVVDRVVAEGTQHAP
jgi:MarR family transcriptional regulator for hemolysin